MVVGGAQENTIFTVKGLAEKRHNITLVAGPTKGPEGSLLHEIEKEEDIKWVIAKELTREINPALDTICLIKLIIFLEK